MKKIIKKFVLGLFIFLSIGMSSDSYGHGYKGYDDLSYFDEKILLKLIGARYSESWDEGVYGFYFNSFDCSFTEEECLFSFDYWDRRDGPVDPEEETCVVSAASERDLFTDRFQRQMTNDLHDQIDECIYNIVYWAI